MRNYELEEFLMHYGVPNMKRPRGLKYKTRGSTSLYANRRAQMYRRNTESEESDREKAESDVAVKKIKQKSKKSKSMPKKDFVDRVKDEQAAKLIRALENEARNRYKREWHSIKMVQDVDNVVKPVQRTKTQNKKFNKMDKYVRK